MDIPLSTLHQKVPPKANIAMNSYDIWAIQFGYDPDMNGERRDAHLKRSLEPLLTFGNDADDMRSAGKAIDPRVNIGDLSGDTLAWSEQRLALVAETMANLENVSLKDGESFQRLYNNFNTLLRQKSSVGGIVSRYIGGVYVERGTTEYSLTFSPIHLHRNKLGRAMIFLAHTSLPQKPLTVN